MEFLRRLIRQIKAHLGQLTISQRLLIILLMVIMFGAVYWMVLYSSQMEMVPLLDQSFSDREMQQIVQKLEGWNVDYVVKGDRILVAKSHQNSLITRLGWEELLPQDTSVGWNTMLQDQDIFIPESVRETKRKIVLQMKLAQAIEDFPGVEKAEVFINEGSKRRLVGAMAAASASVTVTTAGTIDKKRLAKTIAGFVSAANGQMMRENVNVTIDGVGIPVLTEGEEINGEYLAEKTKSEQLYRDKILSILPMAHVLVQVDVTLQITKTEKQSSLVAPEDEGSWNPKKEDTTREEGSESSDSKQEPGVIANVASAAQSNTGSTQVRNVEETTKVNQPIPGTIKTLEVTPMGGIKDLTASVMIPDYYFVEMAKKDKNEEPNPEQVAAIIDQKLPVFKQMVMRAVGLESPKDDNKVVVDTYWAKGVVADGTDQTRDGGRPLDSASSVMGVVNQYGKHIAVSALAVVSLFMVLMMVRKAAGPVQLSEEQAGAMINGPKPLDALSLEESNIVDGEAPSGLLAGLELGEDAVRTQQVLDQIKSMVGESPEVASTLIKKWIAQSN